MRGQTLCLDLGSILVEIDERDFTRCKPSVRAAVSHTCCPQDPRIFFDLWNSFFRVVIRQEFK